MPSSNGPSTTASLLDAIEAFTCRFVLLPNEDAAVATTLFIAHTHAFQAAHATPYLVVNSPEKQSGKSRLLEVISLLSADGWMVSNVTPAVIYRKIERERPTVIVDEVDTIFTARSGDMNEALRGVLNAGNRPSAKVSRCVGQAYEVHDFSVYSPKVLGGIDNGALPATITDRAIVIKMQRKRPDETVERFRLREVEPEAEALRAQLHEWAEANLDALAAARPEFPDGLSDRMEDAWEPLFAIADLGQSAWDDRARDAAVGLHAARDAEEENPGILLITALRNALMAREVISSSEMVNILNADERLPFGAYRGGKGLDPRELAKLLKPFDIRPKSIREGSNSNHKGYARRDFEDAWTRYLPASPESRHIRHIRHTDPPEPIQLFHAHGDNKAAT